MGKRLAVVHYRFVVVVVAALVVRPVCIFSLCLCGFPPARIGQMDGWRFNNDISMIIVIHQDHGPPNAIPSQIETEQNRRCQ